MFQKFSISFIIVILHLNYFCTGISVHDDLLLTISQKHALDKFRERVTPLLYRDFMKYDIYLIRWLRARNYDVASAEEMLRTHINWRKERKIDGILEENWDDIKQDYHATIDTHDREGRPIGVIDIWDWDIRGRQMVVVHGWQTAKGKRPGGKWLNANVQFPAAVLRGRSERLLRYADYLMETMTMQVFDLQKRGMNVTQWIFLGNANGFNVVDHACTICLPLWVQLVQDMDTHYAGFVHEFIIIDAPSTINIVLETVKPFLSRSTRNALKIFGPNRRQWMPYIEKRIDKNQRRSQYGGTKPPLRD